MRALVHALSRPFARFASAASSRLYRKYALSLALAGCVGLLGSGIADIYFAQRELRTRLTEVRHEKAAFAAWRVEQFFRDIEQQLGWIAAPAIERPLADVRLDLQRLLRQVPAVSELHLVDARGREELFVSRFNPDRIGSGRDWSREDAFVQSAPGRTYASAVYFRRETEPYLSLSVREGRPGGDVLIAEVNLKAIWRVISGIRVGETGYSYAVDESGRLVAHPDLTLVLSRTSVVGLPQVGTALARLKGESAEVAPRDVTGVDMTGAPVMTSDVPLPSLRWVVFVEQPIAEA
ncbi:MAG TPA: cache domain-containing protein, partial [Burkholderiales bacterium]|nr:cache domain-containing protein [Burkholderiales bacterium]